jgi:hypothetical protein
LISVNRVRDGQLYGFANGLNLDHAPREALSCHFRPKLVAPPDDEPPRRIDFYDFSGVSGPAIGVNKLP